MPDENGSVVNNTEATDTSPTDSTPVENPTSDADSFPGFDDDSFDEPDEDSPITADETEDSDSPVEEDGQEPEKADEEQTEDTEESDEPQSKAEQRKQQLNTEIRDLVSQRNELKAQVENLNTQAYPIATEEELQNEINPETGEYYSTVEAKLARMEQQQQLRDYNERVADAQLTVTSEVQRVVRDFPMFDSQSPEYNESAANTAYKILEANLVQDPNTGQIISSRVSPYELYKSFADVMQTSSAAGAAKGQKAVEKMLNNADVTGSRSSGPSKKDPFLDAFDADEY